MHKQPPLPVGTVLQKRYRIVRVLGSGGMGMVYEVINDEIQASFALKQTFAKDDVMRQAFKREVRMLADVTHDAIPRVFDYFTENNDCFLLMELVKGDDLLELLQKRKAPFEPEQVLDWADQILDALEELHAQGIVHRDIKPSNLKLTPKGKIKLLDFGIAKGTYSGVTTVITTQGNTAGATIQYAPLEQVLTASDEWNRNLSAAYPEKITEYLRCETHVHSDLFALGATLYQLLTNHLPVISPLRAVAVWSGRTDLLRPAHQLNPKVLPEISVVLNKSMELDCADRPSSAREMRDALKKGDSEFEAIINFIKRYRNIVIKHKDILIAFIERLLPLEDSGSDDKHPLENKGDGSRSRKAIAALSGVCAVAVLGTAIAGISLTPISQNLTSNPENNNQPDQTANAQTQESINNNIANSNAPVVIDSPKQNPSNTPKISKPPSITLQKSPTSEPMANLSAIQTPKPTPEPIAVSTPVKTSTREKPKPKPTQTPVPKNVLCILNNDCD